MSHTTEPWAYDGSDVVATIDQFPTVIADCINHASIVRHNAEANARRIAACVNALVGWEISTIEKYCTDGTPGNPNLGQAFAAIKAQRDELLALIKKIKEWDISDFALAIPVGLREEMQRLICEAKSGAR